MYRCIVYCFHSFCHLHEWLLPDIRITKYAMYITVSFVKLGVCVFSYTNPTRWNEEILLQWSRCELLYFAATHNCTCSAQCVPIIRPDISLAVIERSYQASVCFLSTYNSRILDWSFVIRINMVLIGYTFRQDLLHVFLVLFCIYMACSKSCLKV